MILRIRILLRVGSWLLPLVLAAAAASLPNLSSGGGISMVAARANAEAGSSALIAEPKTRLSPRPADSQADDVSSKSLEFVATVILPGSAWFAAEEHFIEDISSRACVPIAWLGSTFRRRLAGKVEQGVEAAVVTMMASDAKFENSMPT